MRNIMTDSSVCTLQSFHHHPNSNSAHNQLVKMKEEVTHGFQQHGQQQRNNHKRNAPVTVGSGITQTLSKDSKSKSKVSAQQVYIFNHQMNQLQNLSSSSANPKPASGNPVGNGMYKTAYG